MNTDEPTIYSDTSTKQSRISRVSILVTILLMLTLVMCYLIPSDPLIAARLQVIVHPPVSYASNMGAMSHILTKDDPPLGLTLPQDKIGNAIRNAAKSTDVAYMVVPVGDCANCITTDVKVWEQVANKKGIRFILYSTGTKKDIADFSTRMKLTCPTVSDPDNIMGKRLNMAWIARPYLFSRQWRLVWFQNEFHIGFNPFTDITFQRAVLESENNEK